MEYLRKKAMYQLITEKLKDISDQEIQEAIENIPAINDSIYEAYRGLEKIEIVISDQKKNLYRVTMMRSGNMVLFMLNQIFENEPEALRNIITKEMKLDKKYLQLLSSRGMEP